MNCCLPPTTPEIQPNQENKIWIEPKKNVISDEYIVVYSQQLSINRK